MKIFQMIFGKKYLDWDEYREKIKTLDENNFRKQIEIQNKKARDEDMNLSS